MKLKRAPLIAASELKSALAGGTKLRILNATVGRPIADVDNDTTFKKERIPDSSMLNLDEIGGKQVPGLGHQTPQNPMVWNSYMQQIDVTPRDTVVLYDDVSPAGACKSWWMMQRYGVSSYILDGGLPAWKKVGGNVEDGEEKHNHRKLDTDKYTFTFDNKYILNQDDINSCSLRMRKEGIPYEIVDARSGPRFRSEVDEPRPGLRRGNIPGSKNVFFKDLFNNDMTFKSDEEIRQVFKDAGIDLSKHIAFSCGSSVTASVLAFALTLIKHEGEKHIYEPSWGQYGKTDQLTDELIEAQCLSKSNWYKDSLERFGKVTK